MRTAIVCSAGYLVGKGYGKLIDAHTCVVRVNSGFELCKLYPDDVGIKTNVCYVNYHIVNHRHTYRFPPGAAILRKNFRKDISRNKNTGYIANTGMLALIDFVHRGNKCTVFGMDFYSAPFGGIIPDSITPKSENIQTLNREAVYIPEYDRKRFGDTHKLAHVGGLNDFRILLQLMDEYGVEVDEHMKGIVELNRGRV